MDIGREITQKFSEALLQVESQASIIRGATEVEQN